MWAGCLNKRLCALKLAFVSLIKDARMLASLCTTHQVLSVKFDISRTQKIFIHWPLIVYFFLLLKIMFLIQLKYIYTYITEDIASQ